MNESTSLKGMVTQRRKAFAESENTESEYEKDNNLLRECPEPPTSFCINCCNSMKPGDRPKIKKRQNLLTCRPEIRNPIKPPFIEELEMKVLNEELIERELSDKQLGSRQQMEDITDLLRTIAMYAQSLETRHKLSKRLQTILNRIIPEKVEFCRPIKDSNSWLNFGKRLKELIFDCSEECEVPDIYYDALCECNDKYKDFTKASSNFCRILQQNSGISNSQLRKLEKQYEEIRANYSESKAFLNCHMDQLIESRVTLVDRCLQNLAPTISQAVECDKEMLGLIHDLSLTDIILNPPPEKRASHRSLAGNKIYRRVVGQEPEMDKCTCNQQVLGGSRL